MALAVRTVTAQRPVGNLSAEEARKWIADSVSDLASKIGNLAVAAMKPKIDGKQRTANHTSWASKIFQHALPEFQSFVWDTNARMSLNTRHRRKISDLAYYDYRHFLRADPETC